MIPPRVQMSTTSSKARMDMYATLSVLSAVLVVLSVVLLLWGGVDWPQVVLDAAAFALILVIAARVAIARWVGILHDLARDGFS